MNLKNYTSDVPASTSMGKIERCLVEAGATDISKKYSNGVCTAITFRMMVDQQPLFFKLPARVEACYDVFWAEVKRPRSDTQSKIRQQAEKTAWKIICDWTEVQLSMIKLEQVDSLQIFLPFAYNPVKDQTFYEQLKEQNFKALLPSSK